MLAPNKKLLRIHLLMPIILSLLWIGCQGNEKKTELRLAWWGTQRLHACTLQAVALYEQQHPNISITCEYTSWRDYWTKLEMAAANQNLPDIIQQDYTLLDDWAERGLLLSLDNQVKSHLIDLGKVPKTVVNVGKVHDKMYGISLGYSALAWLLDEEAFARAGLSLPPADWTWDDFENISLNLAKKSNMDGFTTRLYNYQICRSYLLGYKEWWYQADGKSLNYSDDHFINYLKMLIRLQEHNTPLNRDQALTQLDDEKAQEADPIIAQTTAMSYMWTNHLMAVHNYFEKKNRKLSLHTAPRPKGGQPADYIKPTMFFAITRDTKHAKEAAKFIDWFINSQEANKLLMAERGVPLSRKIQKVIKPRLSPLQRQIFDFVNYVTVNGTPTPNADPDANVAVRDNIYYLEVVDPVMYKDRTPEEAASIFRLMAGEVLARN